MGFRNKAVVTVKHMEGEERGEGGTPLEGELHAKGIAHAQAQRQENGTFRKTQVKEGGRRVVGQGVTKLELGRGQM